MTAYAKHLSPKTTPQTQPLRGQVANSAGGFSFAVDKWSRLERFLILGCEGGSYYAGERKLTKESVKALLECAAENPVRTVEVIVAISEAGRAPKNDPAIFALAVLASQPLYESHGVSKLALEAMPKVCRTGTHLFQFVESANELRGWGRGLRNAVGNWYLSKDADKLAYQVTKYAQRNGWSHRDLLRLSHPVPKTAGHKDVFQYVAQPEKWLKSTRAGTRILVMAEEAKTASTARLCKMIREEGLVREHLPTEKLNEPAIWEALLDNMPPTALIRNLNKLAELGITRPLSEGTRKVVERLTDAELLKAARLHPFNLLVTLKTYSSGQGFRGGKSWTPTPEVVSALEQAFYLSFGTIEPTNKRYLFGVDVSGSMGGAYINGTNVNCASAAATLAMVGVRTEPRSYAFGFCSDFRDLNIHAGRSLADIERQVSNMDFGSTDCALPITYALKNKIEVDAFVILTDSETYCGSIHPTQALKQYREKMGIPAKLVVVGMVANNFTVADPTDAGQLDCVGFDTAAPSIIADFVRG